MDLRQYAVTLTAALAVVYAGSAGAAYAQNSATETPPADITGPAPSPFLLEPEVQIKGDNIKNQTYNSQPAGENKNWNLDIGRFQPPVNEDPNQLADDLEGSYSGMRLRLPFRGRTGQ